MSDLKAAVAALHERVDGWAAAVQAIGADADDPLEDPRLEAAEEEFEHAVAAFQRAALTAMGVDVDDEDEDEDLEVEELALHLLVGLPESAPEPAQDPRHIVHTAGQRLVAQLTTAGYVVPAWQLGCRVELLLDDDDLDDEDDDEDEL